MPLTFLAHQVPVLPLKLWRPRWFDGVALCVGSTAPDFAYPLGGWLADRSHDPIGVLVWTLPFTLVACALIRWRLARAVFAQLPDGGPLRLHSYRVLGRRRPAGWQTLTSAVLGAATHVVVDAFTHTDRAGSTMLGFDRHLFTAGPRDFTVAGALQYTGHTLGSLVGLLLLVHVGRTRRLETWYGPGAVAAARTFRLSVRARVGFWALVAAGPLTGLLWAANSDEFVVFTVMVATVAAVVVAGCVVPASGAVAAGQSTPPTSSTPARTRDATR